MEITTAMIKELRERTGAGILDCKSALAETNGDEPRAQDVLHGLPQAQVHCQRERSQQLRQPETRVAFAHLHGQTLRAGLVAAWSARSPDPGKGTTVSRILTATSTPEIPVSAATVTRLRSRGARSGEGENRYSNRAAAELDQQATRLLVPSALPLRARGAQARRSNARAGRQP